MKALCHIGIDLGTSGCRLIAINDSGHIVAQAKQSLPPSQRQGNAATQNPRDWWVAFRHALTDLTNSLPDYTIASMAVDGTSATIIVCDLSGTPLAPARMYDDASFSLDACLVAKAAPVNSPARGATSTLAKYLGLRRTLALPGPHIIVHQADWIASSLCDQWGISDENNALKLGYDVQERRWPEWLKDLEIDMDVLPEVYPAGTVRGRVSPGMAKLLDLPNRPWVINGTTDSIAAFIAAGACRPGEGVTSLGSTIVLKTLSLTAIEDARHGIYSHRLGDLWLVGGASNCGGATLLQYFTERQLTELSSKIDPERPTQLDYYPLPRSGERFPLAAPDLAPKLTPRPPEDHRFLQGILEGLAKVEARGYDLLETLGTPRTEYIITSGGGAVNHAWLKIRQRICSRSISIASHTSAAYGSARLALNAMSKDKEISLKLLNGSNRGSDAC